MRRKRARFSQYQVVRARGPALFGRENPIAVVILLRELARINDVVVRTFLIFREGEVLALTKMTLQ